MLLGHCRCLQTIGLIIDRIQVVCWHVFHQFINLKGYENETVA
jgi:hypothetical protein